MFWRTDCNDYFKQFSNCINQDLTLIDYWFVIWKEEKKYLYLYYNLRISFMKITRLTLFWFVTTIEEDGSPTNNTFLFFIFRFSIYCCISITTQNNCYRHMTNYIKHTLISIYCLFLDQYCGWCIQWIFYLYNIIWLGYASLVKLFATDLIE